MSEMQAWKGAVVAVVAAGALVPLLLCGARPPSKGAAEASAAAPKAPETWDLDAIDRYLTAVVKTDGYVGLSVALARDGQVVFAKGYGTTAKAGGAPVTADTAFAIGSVTKQFTCAAAYALEEDGKLAMTDPVAKYFPDVPRAADVTLDDLGAHVSGYTDYYPLDFFDRRMREAIEPDAIVKRYAGPKLDFEPRARYAYSNTGYVLLGRVLEKAGGKPLASLFAERLWKPAGMEHTSLEPADDPKRLAQGHRGFAFEEPQAVAREAPHWLWAAGAMYASAGDLARWDVALTGGKILSPASYRAMTTPRTTTSGRSTLYGCGLGVGPRAGEMVYEHGGEVSGFLADNFIVPRTRSAIVVLSNAEGGSPHKVVDAIGAVLLREHRPPPPKVDGAPVKEVARAMFTALQKGQVDRAKLADEFSAFLTDAMLAGTARRLASYGELKEVEIDRQGMRGGIEASVVKLTFASGPALEASMYRSLDGKVEQFLVYKP
jgi:CubicO group peptidase (beta-lactamase class C family)